MGKLQNEDHKTEAEITGAGGVVAQLLNDTKIYVSANSINKTLDDAIVDGDIGGSGGSLDIFYQQNFEIDGASALSSGNNATFLGAGAINGTLVDETTAPLSGATSIKYTQAASSLNDYISSPAFTAPLKVRGSFVGATINYSYDGDEDDIDVFLYDETNGDILEDSRISLKSGSFRIEMASSVPLAATELRWGFQTIVENIGAILIFDDIEVSSDPFTYVNLQEQNSFSAKVGTTGTIDSQGAMWIDSISKGGTGVYNVTFVAGFFTQSPAVAASSAEDLDSTQRRGTYVQNISTSGCRIETESVADTNSDASFTLTAARQGTDYKEPQENVISPASTPEVETNLLTSDITSTGDMTDLTFDDLVIGARYEVTFTPRIGFTSSGGSAVVDIENGATVVGHFLNDSVSSDQAGQLMSSSTFKFTAVDTTLIFNATGVSAGVTIQGNNTVSETSAQLQKITAKFLAAIPVPSKIVATQQETSGTSGGDFTAGSWQTRDLNTLDTTGPYVSISSSQVVITPGRYLLSGWATAYQVNGNQCRLQDITNGQTVTLGSTVMASTTSGTNTTSRFSVEINITETTTYELQHRCQSTLLTIGFGVDISIGNNNVFAGFETIKVK